MAKKSYNEAEMKKYMKKYSMSKQKRKLCVAGIEMFLLREEDIDFIADENTSYNAAANRLHNLVSAS